MIGYERLVLKIVKELKAADQEALSRKMAVSATFAKEICDGLIKDGYLLKKPKGYILTSDGENAVSRVKVRGPIAVLKGGL